MSASGLLFDANSIRNTLENYVTDMALLSLEPEELQEEHKHSLSIEHDFYMNRLFDNILLSYQWNEADVSFYISLLTSFSIDSIDVRWIIAAISLACINIFDLKKLEVLANVYVSDVSEASRQRALVGWAMALDGNQKLMLPGQKKMINLIVKHDNGTDALKEMQIQLLTSINAIYDDECIRKDIMPILMKHANIAFPQISKDITKPSDIEEILHPENSDKMMNDMETATNKMKAMANKGRDVYYGGFCQTKHYRYFSELAHWFQPFFIENPAIAIELKKYSNIKKTIKDMTSSLPFCDNDKYSFVILLSQMMNKIPAQLFNTLAENQAEIKTMMAEDYASASYLRCCYLHDLFRFHQLYKMKDDFVNGFMMRGNDDVVNVFLADRRLFDEIENYAELCYESLRFLDSLDTKKDEHFYATINKILPIVPTPLKLSDRLFVAHYMWKRGDIDKSCRLYEKMLEEFPDNIYVLRGAARCFLEQKDYQSALNYYCRLDTISKNDINCQLNRSLCLIMLGKTSEAMPILHKLYYDYPDNLEVVRIRLWAMMVIGNAQKITDDYKILCNKCPNNANDRLNYGYCLWLSCKIIEAINEFKIYLRLLNRKNGDLGKSIYPSFQADKLFCLVKDLVR